jgi:hypothetical protein
MLVGGLPLRQKGTPLLQQRCRQKGTSREGSTHWGAARLAPLPGILHHLHVVPAVQDEGVEQLLLGHVCG